MFIFLLVVILGVISNYYYFFNNTSEIFGVFYLVFGFFKTFIHEFGHGIAPIITWGYIETIDMLLTQLEAMNKGSLGICYSTSGIGIISSSFISYN